MPPTGFARHASSTSSGVQRRLDRSNLGFGPKLRRGVRDAHGAAPAPPAARRRLRRRLRQPARRARRPAGCASRSSSSSRTPRPGAANRWRPGFAAASRGGVPRPALPRAGGDRQPAARPRSLGRRPGPRPGRGRAALGLAAGPLRRRWSPAARSARRVLNDAVRGVVAALRPTARDLAVRHVVGEPLLTDDATAAAGPARDGILYHRGRLRGAHARWPTRRPTWSCARAGASTVAELAAVGVPSILVPVAGRRRRPPDRQRPAAGRRRRRRRWSPTPSSTPTGWRARSTRSLADPPPLPAMAAAARPRRDPPADAADARSPTWPSELRPSERAERPGAVDDPTRAPLDLARPGRYHVVGVGGPGMSAIALVLAEMGHDVSGSDLRELAGARPAARRRASPSTSATTATTSTASTPSPSRPPSRPATSSSWRPPRPGVPVLRRAGMLAAICAQRRTRWPWPAPTARRPPRRCWPWSWPRPGCEPSFVVGGDLNEVGTRRALAAASGWWSRPTRATARSSSCRSPAPSSPTSRPTTSTTTAPSTRIVDGLRPLPGRRSTGPKVAVRRRPGRRAAWPRRHDAVTYGTDRRRRLPGRRRRRRRAGALRFAVDRDGEELGRGAPPAAGRAQRAATPPAPSRWPTPLGVPFEAAAAALGPLRRRRPPLRVRGDADGITLVDDYAHLPGEIAAVLDAAAASGDGWRRVVCRLPAPPLQPHGGAVAGVRATRSSTPTSPSSPTSTRPARRPIPGVTGKLVVDAVLDAHPGQRVVWLPERADLRGVPRRRAARRATCASRGLRRRRRRCPTRCWPVSSARAGRDRCAGGRCDRGGGERPRHAGASATRRSAR